MYLLYLDVHGCLMGKCREKLMFAIFQTRHSVSPLAGHYLMLHTV